MNTPLREAAQYVKRTNGGATKQLFLEDHAPIGEWLWRDLVLHGFVLEDLDGRIWLTPAAIDALAPFAAEPATGKCDECGQMLPYHFLRCTQLSPPVRGRQ